MYETALQHFNHGRLTEAAACCSAALNQTPCDFRTLRLLGQVRSRQGAFADASYILIAALGIGSPDPDDVVVALNELATIEAMQQHYDEAIGYYRRALAIAPDDTRTLYNYGNALYDAGQIEAAIGVYREGVSKQPDFAELHNNLGNALRAAGNVQEAADSYQRALTLSPDLVQAHNNLGGILYLLDRAEEAVECHRRAIAINQNDAASLIGEAIALHKLKKYDESSAQYQRALTLCPDDPAALLGFGITLTASDRCDEAAVWLRRAIAVSPADGAARMALGTAFVGLNRHAEAFQQYREAAALMPVSPELTHNEAIALLAMGAWPEGWRRLEARFAVTSFFPAQAFPEHFSFWHGEPGIEGKTILLQAEQGLGDTLQYVRYVPLVAERGARVVLRVQPRLGKLLADMPGADVVMTLYDNPPDVDLICPLMSLPLAFSTTVVTVPARVPYLRTPPDYVGSSRVDLQACKLEYSIVSPK